MSLPVGFRVVITPAVIRADSGGTLIGGSPLTALRLSQRAQHYVEGSAVSVVDAASAQLAERLLATNLANPDLTKLPQAPSESITVVIPVKDRPDDLNEALRPLAGLTVIVVDDASEHPAAVAAVAARHSATYVHLDRNLGPAGARNAGLARVTTPLVAFVDSDVRATTETLLLLSRHFADPKVVLVGPRVVGIPDPRRPRWFDSYEQHASSLTLGTTPASVAPGAAVAWLPSACLLARTDALGAGFTASMRVGEDVDLVWRLVAAGHRVRYDPTVTADHLTRSSLRDWLGRKAFYGTGSAQLGMVHGDAVAPAILSPWYAAAGAAVLLRRPALLPVAAVALAHGAVTVARALPAIPEQRRIATRIAVRGLGWAVRQESALALRHWWPAAAVGAVVSPTVRKALVTALAVDTLVFAGEAMQTGRVPRPIELLARRLDDFAYGAGLSRGAITVRSARALLPRRPVAARSEPETRTRLVP